jgi:hypothetical protein
MKDTRMPRLRAVVAALAITWAAGAGFIGAAGTETEGAAAATLTGCLRQGSGESVFLLRGATGADDSGPRDYLLVSVPSGLELSAALNHRVAIVGDVHAAADGPEPPPGANTVEKALRRLAVQSMNEIEASCAA